MGGTRYQTPPPLGFDSLGTTNSIRFFVAVAMSDPLEL